MAQKRSGKKSRRTRNQETRRRGEKTTRTRGREPSQNRRTRENTTEKTGSITFVATPIGNLQDISERAVQTLAAAECIAAEDTRVTAKLLSKLQLQIPLTRIDEHTSPQKLEKLLDQAEAGASIVVVTDAGTPTISDPGAKLANLAYERNIPVEVVPGPSAITAALAISGFYAQRFAFLGYLPRTEAGRQKNLLPYANSTMTLVIFESPFRIEKLLQSALNTLGDRRVAICRELSKLHQEVKRSKISELLKDLPTQKGEFTIVIEGSKK